MATPPSHLILVGRVTALALVLGLPALYLIAEKRREAVEHLIFAGAEKQALLATNAVVAEIGTVQQSIEHVLRYAAADLAQRDDATPAAVEHVLRAILAASPEIYSCTAAFEPDGFKAAGGRYGPRLRREGTGLVLEDTAVGARQFWQQDWYRDALRAPDFVWSEPFVDEDGTGSHLVRAVMPIFREVAGRRVAVGVVAAAVELGWLKKVAMRHLPFESGFVMVFSRSGRLILHPLEEMVIKETMDSLAKSTGTPELTHIRHEVIGKRQGSLGYFSGVLQKRVRVNYRPAWGARGGGVVVGYEEEEFARDLHSYRRITWISLAATLAVFGLATGVASFVVLRRNASSGEKSASG